MASPEYATTLTLNECSACGILFVNAAHARTHVGLPKCSGATVVKRLCGVAKLDGDHEPSRGRRASRPPPTTLHGNTTAIAHANTVQIVLGSPAGDVVKAGSPLESELIRRTILENADLRRMIRTIENAPGAIFRLTKGRAGPRCLRNVHKDGGRVREMREHGVESSGTIEYCKRAAREMVEELRRAVDAVGPESPAAVREWAADVRRALNDKLCGGLNYVAALHLYCDASSRFYKLPRASRDAIACGVRNIALFIADTAGF